jgi:replicative DNA helicase
VEQSLLDALVTQPALLASLPDLVEEDFQHLEHAVLFRRLALLGPGGASAGSGEPASRSRLADTVGEEYLQNLIRLAAPDPASAARLLAEQARWRRVRQVAEEMLDRSLVGEAPDSAIEAARTALARLARPTPEPGARRGLAPLLDGFVQQSEHAAELGRTGGRQACTPGPVSRLLSGHLPPGITLLVGAHGAGTTALTMAVVSSVVQEHGTAVDVHTTRLTAGEWTGRFLCLSSQLPLQATQRGQLTAADRPRLRGHASLLAEVPFSIDDDPSPALSRLVSACHRLGRSHARPVLIIDDLTAVVVTQDPGGARPASVCILADLAAAARESCVSLLAVVDIGPLRGRPLRQLDLVAAGYATVWSTTEAILFLDRPVTGCDEDSQTEARLRMAWQRNGPTGEFYLRWDQELVQFLGH